LGDGRFLSGGLQLCISAKKTVSTSFDINWKCLRCGQHKQEEAFKIRGVADSSSPRQVVIVADQSFPACLPTDGQHDCIKVIIVENCSLEDGAVEFLKRLGNRRVPKGSVILMFSAAHLANVRLAQYIQDFMDASNKICNITGRETICLPLPAFIMGGTDNNELIRSTHEITAWAIDFYQERDNNMEDSYRLMMEIMEDQAEGEKQIVETRRFTLPANNPSGKRVWVSGGNESKAMPCILKPATAHLETRLVKCLIGELRTKFGLDLEPNPRSDRAIGPQEKAKRKGDLLLVGSSNASKMAEMLSSRGKPTGLLFSPGWTITRQNVDHMAANINKKIAEEDPAVIVLYLMDNSVFFVRQEDGSRHLPIMSRDGIFHATGELRVCSGDVQDEQFRTLRPIFDVIGKRKCLWVAPIPRYVTRGCCEDRTHVTNRTDAYYLEDMRLQLDGLRRHMKEFVYSSGLRNVKVYDPNSDLRDFTVREIWGEDPIHPTHLAMSRMADGITALAETITDEKHREDNAGGRGRGQTRGGHARGRWHDGRMGGRGSHEQGGMDQQNRNQYQFGGRHMSTGRPRGGRSDHGGQYDYRARPY
jgi:hypothetical protein